MTAPPGGQRLRIRLVANCRFPIGEPFTGGLESMTWHLARELVRRGHQVAVFAAPGSDPSLGIVELAVDTLPDHPGRLDLDAPASVEVAEHHAYLSLMLELAGPAGSHYDVLHNNSLHYLPVAMAPSLPMPMLTTLHTPPRWWLESAVHLDGGTSSFAAVSRFTAQSWAPITDSTCVLNGVDVSRWPRRPGGDTAIWSGRLVAEKAPHEAILAARTAGLPLVLVGPVLDPDYFHHAVEPLLGPDATYAGHLDQHDLADLVGRSAVAVVTPAWDEPYGLVAAEALACGTPVAAYARGGLPEVLTPTTGRLATPGDTHALATAIRTAATLDRTHCRTHATDNLSLSRMVDLYEHLYTDLITRRHARMIGYYIHHHGSGHLHRALSVAAHVPDVVTGLSSLPRPEGWAGPWCQLPRDDTAPDYGPIDDVSVRGRLHWAPLDDPGLRDRMAALAAWIGFEAPAAFVVDQSVEVCLLARLHGVPVVGLTAPGRRPLDEAHRLGFDSCAALVGAWPAGWTSRMLPGLDALVADRFEAVGAVSRFAVAERRGPPGRRPHAVLMAGTGGDGFTAEVVARAQEQTPDWDWTVLSRSLGTWHRDPSAVLAEADVVVLHPGQNSLAEVAALRVPALVVPAPRPFEEQQVTAGVLSDGWPALVADTVPGAGWRDLLYAARALDGDGWAAWCDGGAPARIAAVVGRAAGEERVA